MYFNDTRVRHATLRVGELDIFFREAGPPGAPVLLLLHGFPSSSFMFRNLMPRLSREYRVIAPDYPGFGYSTMPDRASFPYTFENLARVMEEFIDRLGLERYALYVQDYGAPIGFRIALERPEQISGLIIQNGNAYEEGLGEAWGGLRAFWENPSDENRAALGEWLTAEGIRQQYVAGVPETDHMLFSPDTWTLDWLLLSRPGSIENQLDLFYDYRTNLAIYPAIHAFIRTWRPPTLITWGQYDPFFTVAGALAYKRDLPEASLRLLPAGHFALETHAAEIAAHILDLRPFIAAAAGRLSQGLFRPLRT